MDTAMADGNPAPQPDQASNDHDTNNATTTNNNLHAPEHEHAHAPKEPSPLNPSHSSSRPPSKTPAPPPIQREQREKKDSLKKRESAMDGKPPPTSSLGKRKANATHAHPSPQRFNVPPPRPQDFEAPKEDVMVSHEPNAFEIPHSHRQLYKPVDLAENKRGYRYQRAIADPQFPHKQFYRATSPPPHYGRFSFEDADRNMHFATDALVTTNEKGWRMVRSNLCAREGTMYYEVKIHKGVPAMGGEAPAPAEGDASAAASGPQPHVRFGFARREAPLDGPVGFDGYSYGITDIRFEPMHRSRPSKFFHPKPKPKKGASKAGLTTAPPPITLPLEDQDVREGDVIGLELQLPSLNLHRKIVTGVYNPAVDIGDGFDDAPSYTRRKDGGSSAANHEDETVAARDIIRDRIPVPYKGNSYFEIIDHVPSKPMDIYTDRQTNLASLSTSTPTATVKDTGGAAIALKAPPNPNHEYASLRTLPHSALRVYKNGKLIGTAFENLLAFLPPASAPSRIMGAREGFDDGFVGYFPAVACFGGGVAEVNFGGEKGGGFWCPPEHVRATMSGAGAGVGVGVGGWNPGRTSRPIGERYREQIAEDVVWDVIDEVDFFMQDGGEVGDGTAAEGGGVGGSSGGGKGSRLKQEV
ncbi:hypothetical protein D0867_15036 [Hortaea werneckii]|uniref:SPRY domain-containing protein n=1 Tax=Hortaea werneckii TaxID=91943 RepID=A0A3M6XKL5_HORWE|nr:hypothetical protein D0867_15036 [Hortaea werneckii]RMY04487.1 hypothetical protein D0866_15335 [Hortaea werneckii]